MKITNQELETLGFIGSRVDSHLWYYDMWEWQFNQETNELFYYNDGFPEEEPTAIITDYNHFVEVLKLIK